MEFNDLLINLILSLEDYKLFILSDNNCFSLDHDLICDFYNDNYDVLVEYFTIDDMTKKIEIRFY